MLFQPRSQVARKTLQGRRLSLEHLENRALLSASPGISRLASAYTHSAAGAASAYSSKATAAAATEIYIVAQPVVQSGVQTTIQLLALDSTGRVVRGYNDQVSLSSTDTTATLPANVRFHNGQARFSVTFNTVTAEQPTITATDSSVIPTLTSSVKINVIAPDVATT